MKPLDATDKRILALLQENAHFTNKEIAALDNIGNVQSSFVMTQVKMAVGLPLE